LSNIAEEFSDAESSVDDDYDSGSLEGAEDGAYQSSASSLDFTTEWPTQIASGIR
jgi:hypothetical protein